MNRGRRIRWAREKARLAKRKRKSLHLMQSLPRHPLRKGLTRMCFPVCSSPAILRTHRLRPRAPSSTCSISETLFDLPFDRLSPTSSASTGLSCDLTSSWCLATTGTTSASTGRAGEAARAPPAEPDASASGRCTSRKRVLGPVAFVPEDRRLFAHIYLLFYVML